MPALPDRIAFIQSEFRRAIVDEPAVRTTHGALARESADPVPTYFDNVADAAIMAAKRQAMLSGERRRFDVSAVGVDEARELDFTGGAIPNAWFVDEARDCDRPMVVTSIVIDLGAQNTEYGLWG